MFLKDAFISIGRVPVLYLPYFFSPGARMIGNPSIGFEINRGMFVNTTFEIFGTYPSFKKTKQSSFSTLLSSSSKPSNVSPGSSIYTESENLTDLQKWAQSTNSYFALIFDAYEKTPYYSESFSTLNDNRGSSVFGYSLNLNLFKDILKIESNTMISLASEGNKNGIEKYNQYSIFRYDGLLNLTLNSKTTSLKIKLPYLSDPKVKKTYSNRLSTFSLDSLWNRNQTFPSSYSSDINFYKWEVEGKYKLPINSKGNFLDYFEISSFEANILSKWKKVDGFYKYAFDSYTLPKFSSKFGGTIFEKNFSEEDELKDSSNEESEKTFDIKLLEKQGLSNFSFSKLAKEFLEKEENTSYKSIIGDVDRLTLSNENEKKVEGIIQLNYDIKDDFYYRTNNLNESNEESELYNKSNLNVLFSSNVFNNNLDIISNLNITNFYKVNNDLKIKTIIKNTNSIKFPQLNFSYFIDLKYFENSYEKTTVEKNDIDYFNFDIDHVSKHSIQWSKKYDFSTYYLVPTLSYILPPLKTILKPSLRYVGSVIDDTISADLDFNSSFYLKSISNKFNLNMGDFLFSLDGKYDFSKNTNSSKFFDPYSLSMLFRYNNKENKISISQFLNYKGISDVGVRNSFSSIKTFFDSKILDSELNISTFENNLSLDYWKNTVKIVDYQNYWWKNRMGIKFSFDSTFNFSFREKYSTYLKLKTDFSFGIAKFLFLDISFTTSNHGFYRYYVGDDFKFSLMMEDLLRSFDFFGNGRHNTQFNLEDVSIDLVHKMEDWDLHCKYKGTVVLSNYTYKWVPTLSIFLQWKTIPELKIENSFSTNSDGSWVRSN